MDTPRRRRGALPRVVVIAALVSLLLATVGVVPVQALTTVAFPTTTATTSGTWVDPGNAFADDGTNATTSVARGANSVQRYGTFGFDASIPVGSTINSVTVEIQYFVSSPAGNFTTTVTALNGGAPVGAGTSSTASPTVDTILTHAATGITSRGQLLDGTFEVSVGAARAASGGPLTATFSLDYVTVTVDYTLPPDTTPPVVTVPADFTVEATSAAGAVVTFTATATDDTDGALTPTCTPPSGSTFPLGTTTVTCTATDAAGNTGSASFDVTVEDTTPPVVTVPADITAPATGPSGAVVTFSASATDAVDGPITPTCVPPSGSLFPIGTTTVTCTATDAAGNTGSASFTVTVEDTTAPVVTVPADITAEATSAAGAVVTFTATATDDVDGPITPTCAPPSSSTFPITTTTVTCTATDAAGNTGSASFDVTIEDTTPPVVTVPADITAEATSAAGAVVTFTATATDTVDGAITPTCAPPSGSTVALGTTTVTCSATDAAGNPGSATFTVTVEDTTPPVVTVPADITVPATGPSGAIVTFSASATDAVDGAVATVCTPPSGGTFPIGTTTVTCTATDAAGNTGSATFAVTVTPDTTPPVVTVPADITAEATSAAGAVVTFTATATDDVDGALTPTCAPPSGSTFPLGTTTVTCTATDAAGNTGSATFAVTVADTTPPVLTIPTDVTVPAAFPGGAFVGFSASATDAVDGPITPICMPPSGSLFPIGTTTVTCTATDAAGNTASGSFDLTVSPDTTPPVVTVPADFTVEATSAAGAVVTFTATATDDTDGALTPTCTPPSGSTFPLGTTIVTCTATDAAGNTGSATFNLTVEDTTSPVVTVPADITAEATSNAGAVVTFTATALDDVDGALTPTCTPPSGSTFPLGTTTVTCTATDAAGNVASDTFDVVVTAPSPSTSPPAPSASPTVPPTDAIGDGGARSGGAGWIVAVVILLAIGLLLSAPTPPRWRLSRRR